MTRDPSNVVHFPSGRHASTSVELLRDIAPDVRQVGNVAAAFGYEQPDPGLRDEADRAMAVRLGDLDLPCAPAARSRVIDAVFLPVLQRAMQAINEATSAGRQSDRAQGRIARMLHDGGRPDEKALARASALTQVGAHALLEAHLQAECALGAWRAVELARKGDGWTPRDPRPDHDWLWQAEASGR
jgi:hypothetical protein